jgi:hypothetical protein
VNGQDLYQPLVHHVNDGLKLKEHNNGKDTAFGFEDRLVNDFPAPEHLEQEEERSMTMVSRGTSGHAL